MLWRAVVRRGALFFLVTWSDLLLRLAGVSCHNVLIVLDQVYQGPIAGDSDGLPIQLNEELPVKFLVAAHIRYGDDPRNRWADFRGTGAGGGSNGGNQTFRLIVGKLNHLLRRHT